MILLAAAILIVITIGFLYSTSRIDEELVIVTPESTITPSATQLPIPTAAPALTPRPSPLPIKNVVDEIIQSDIRTIRIFERSMQDYKAHETPFFSVPDPTVMIFPSTLHPWTAEDLAQLPNRVKISSSTTKSEIPFSTTPLKPGDSTSVPLTLILKDVPQEDLLIRFLSVDGKQEKQLILRYSQPIGYTVTSADDPHLEKYMSMLKEGLYINHYVELGKRYTYRFQFTHDMNRDSVQEKLIASLKSSKNLSYEWSWDNDKVLKLQLDLREEANSSFIPIYLNGVRNKEGYRLSSERAIRIQPSRPQSLYQINLTDLSTTSLFSSSMHYDGIDVSPSGNYGLAVEVASNELHAIYAYSLIDMKGHILKSFGIDEIHLTKWSPDGNSFYYLRNNTIMQYSMNSGEQKVLWTPPDQATHSRVVSLDMDPKTGQLVVGWGTHDENGQFTYDFYVLSDRGKEPMRIPNVGTFSCYEGPCFLYGLRMIENGEMYMESYLDKENPPRHTAYMLNLSTGAKKEVVQRIQDAGLPGTMLDIGNGQLLSHKYDQDWYIVDKKSGSTAVFELIPKEVSMVSKWGDFLYFFDALR
jgi:hypothetical protein